MISDRIKELRNSLGITQQELADTIGVKRNTVATYEMGRSIPSDSALSLLCREFNVSEEWLRTGKGEMYNPVTRDEALAEAFGKILADEKPSFKRQLFHVLCSLDVEQWKVLEDVLMKLVDECQEGKGE